MNDILERIFKFTYYKNRIIATLGLIVGLFNPLIGLGLVGIAFMFSRQASKTGIIKPDKQERLFILLALILLAAFTLIYFINVIELMREGSLNSSQSA